LDFAGEALDFAGEAFVFAGEGEDLPLVVLLLFSLGEERTLRFGLFR